MPENEAPNNSASETDATKLYSAQFEVYSAYTRLLHATVENLMRAAGIEYLPVTSRPKSIASFTEKMTRKEYSSKNEYTFLAGIRVNTFLQTYTPAAAHLLQPSFASHPRKSLDDHDTLGE